MSPPAPKSVRRRFLAALGRGLYVTWPVLSGILVIEVALGRHEEASPHALWH